MNWATIIRQRSALTAKFAREVPLVLCRDDVTIPELHGLCIAVIEHHQIIEALIVRMAKEGTAEDSLLEAARALDKACDGMVAALLDRLSEIRRVNR